MFMKNHVVGKRDTTAYLMGGNVYSWLLIKPWVDKNVSLRILCANISKEDVQFDNVLRALKWCRQSENKITLEDIVSVLNACKQA